MLAGRIIAPFKALHMTASIARPRSASASAPRTRPPPLVAESSTPYSWMRGSRVEVESGRVMLELGPVGFLLVYLAAPLPGRSSPSARPCGCAPASTARWRPPRFLFFLAQLPGGIVFDVTAGVYYWFFAGLLLLAVRLDREAARPQSRRERGTAGAAVRSTPCRPDRAPSLAPAQRWPAMTTTGEARSESW